MPCPRFFGSLFELFRGTRSPAALLPEFSPAAPPVYNDQVSRLTLWRDSVLAARCLDWHAMPAHTLPFQMIAPHVAVGAPVPPGWRSIAELPLLILVGVTGVGKSTLLAELARHGPAHQLLPDRRVLTDQLIIGQMQVEAGEPRGPVTDRGQRFAYTRRYREQFPGGMAHALAQLWLATDAPAPWWVYDGLRGENEVSAAAASLPLARFVMLDAPDLVRVQRLLGRGDAFDQIAPDRAVRDTAATDLTSLADLGLPAAQTLFTPAAEETLLGWVRRGTVPAADLRAKLQIVIEERRSYDPTTTLDALRRHAPTRTLYLDTVAHAPAAVADQVLAWLHVAEEQ